MKVISPRIHGFLDYITVVLFASVPSLISLPPAARGLCYLLAVVHLVMTLLTAFPFGAAKVLPLLWHGWVELAVSLALPLVAWIGFPSDPVAAGVFLSAAGIIFLVWLCTEYKA